MRWALHAKVVVIFRSRVCDVGIIVIRIMISLVLYIIGRFECLWEELMICLEPLRVTVLLRGPIMQNKQRTTSGKYQLP